MTVCCCRLIHPANRKSTNCRGKLTCETIGFAPTVSKPSIYAGQRPSFGTLRDVLTRFFDDGRLVLSNNGAERALKGVALGRKAWLFCGSDDHAKSTAALFSLVASARLHRLDPEEYLRCLIRLVPLWPEDRMLELAPLFWTRTRARLDADALCKEIGPIVIPAEPLDTSTTSEQQVAAG